MIPQQIHNNMAKKKESCTQTNNSLSAVDITLYLKASPLLCVTCTRAWEEPERKAKCIGVELVLCPGAIAHSLILFNKLHWHGNKAR